MKPDSILVMRLISVNFVVAVAILFLPSNYATLFTSGFTVINSIMGIWYFVSHDLNRERERD